MAFRHTFSEIKLLNFCRGKARVNLIWDFIRYIQATILGLKVEFVQVEADAGNGLPMFHMVGYLSSEVKEAAEQG